MRRYFRKSRQNYYNTMRLTRISLSNIVRSDFFGITGIGPKVIAGQLVQDKLTSTNLEKKYDPLSKSRNRLKNEEILSSKNFGTIRYDFENSPKEHGQFEIDNDKPMFETSDIKEMYQLNAHQQIEPEYDGNSSVNLQPKVDLDQVLKNFRLDSRGCRVYEMTDWSRLNRTEIIDQIRKNVIYDNYDIIAINKPYGLESHGIASIMQDIVPISHLAHRLDKTTTGVLLFARSAPMAEKLNKLFRSCQITKSYWCITSGIPAIKHATIDIPIGDFEVAGKVRSCLAPEGIPDRCQLAKDFRLARRAITEYKVLEEVKCAALVEVKPSTGVKHQIRCHMAFGIGQPILGDHKYSHIGKIAPQRLQKPILKALRVRQTKTRTIPVHLHAKQIVIPGAKANNETLFIGAPLPSHFLQTMRLLGIRNER